MIRLKHSSTRAFTLIELMVVITIIAILAGLAFPALNRAIRSAQTTESISNLRQIHILLMTYANENNYKFPDARGEQSSGGSGSYTSFWRRTIWEHSNGEFDHSNVESEMANGGYADIMWCPLVAGGSRMEQNALGRGSYALNNYFKSENHDGSTGALPQSEYKRLTRADFKGVREPIVMGGTVLENNPEWGTNEVIDSSLFPYDTDWMNLNYAYGGGGQMGLGLYKNGNVEMIKREDGIELHSLLSDPASLE
jgi:prepilin-type N-terminal cleavage/methylation domain-containing protein